MENGLKYQWPNKNCKSGNKDGFVSKAADKDLLLKLKNSPYLQQTKMLVYMSWTAEYAHVKDIEMLPDGSARVKFTKALRQPFETLGAEGGYRYQHKAFTVLKTNLKIRVKISPRI